MSNLAIYDMVRTVPEEAKKTIKGGRLNGFTDINPMWRIKTLTDVFGMVGFGWYYEVLDKRLELTASGECAAFVDINLFVKFGDEWSKPILGTGGAAFIAKESAGLRMSDECFKMALTDAISVACKALGVGADVYWEKDSNKYDTPDGKPQEAPKEPSEDDKLILEILSLGKERSIEAACQKKFGKGLRKLSTAELKTVRGLLKEDTP